MDSRHIGNWVEISCIAKIEDDKVIFTRNNGFTGNTTTEEPYNFDIKKMNIRITGNQPTVLEEIFIDNVSLERIE